ncbi:hypothetical protein, partial [Burkholderia stabilis]
MFTENAMNAPIAPIAPTAVVLGWELDTAPFHAGELAVQQRAGVTEAAGAAGRRGIRRFMPDQHRTFFAQ